MTTQSFFFIFIPILAFILLMINILLAPHNPYEEKDSAFECGFHSFLGQNRSEFNISFFVFALLFLIFDLEILLIYPYITSAYTNGMFGLLIMLVFFIALTLGFVYELGKGALSIDSRQNGEIETNGNTISNNTISKKSLIKQPGISIVNTSLNRPLIEQSDISTFNKKFYSNTPRLSIESDSSGEESAPSLVSDDSDISCEYITSQRGDKIKVVTENSSEQAAAIVNDARNDNVQHKYDKYMDRIDKAHSVHLENTAKDKENDLSKLEQRELETGSNLSEERKRIEDEYDKFFEENVNYTNQMKDIFNGNIWRDDVIKRDLHGNSEESTSTEEESVNAEEESVNPQEESVNPQEESVNPQEESLNKRSREDSSEVENLDIKESSTKKFKQDSSDVNADSEPMDISFDE